MSGRLWRSGGKRFVATILTFALMLQGMALALATGRLAAGAGDSTDWSGFEICHHSGPAAPGGWSQQQSHAHCIFCLAGAAHAVGGQLPSAQFQPVAFAIRPWTFEVWRLPAHTVAAGARPRGPPPA